MSKELSEGMFRRLDHAEELEFRVWARENWSPGDEINPTWHPVIRDEIDNIAQEENTDE